MTPHQYIVRETNDVKTEKLYWDKVVSFCYSRIRESSPAVFRTLTGPRISGFLGFISYDFFMSGKLTGPGKFVKRAGIDLSECLEDPVLLDTPKKIFERKIRYEKVRPMPPEKDAVVSPADAKMLTGSLNDTDMFFVKEKFFQYKKLFGEDKREWLDAFLKGDFAIFRLTPEKYHYNHLPVSGVVKDIYEIGGSYHSCNPGAVVMVVTPYSMNKRVVTVIDTDVPGGTGIGLVAMIEVVALMIGEIVQCYSETGYDDPSDVTVGMFVKKGCPKSLYRPGSSTDVLVFQEGRVEFAGDIMTNQNDRSISSRFTTWFGNCLVETEVKVRSGIACRKV